MKLSSSRLLRLCGRLSVGLLLLAGLCLALGVPVRPAHAQSTMTVSDCSSDSQLQADVTQANSDNDGDTITFSCSGDILLSSTLTISGSMTLDGSGQSVTLDGGGSTQVLVVNRGIYFILNALTIAKGFSNGNGGGLANNGSSVSISNSVFTGNSVPTNQSGGAIYNTGSLTISDSTFTNTSGYSVLSITPALVMSASPAAPLPGTTRAMGVAASIMILEARRLSPIARLSTIQATMEAAFSTTSLRRPSPIAQLPTTRATATEAASSSAAAVMPQ